MGQSNPLDGKRILVVDDEILIGMDIADSLRDGGAQIAGPFLNSAQT